MILLISVFDLQEAYVLKSILEYSGVECRIVDEYTTTFESAIGGVKLYIRENDLEKAKLILDSYYKNKKNN